MAAFSSLHPGSTYTFLGSAAITRSRSKTIPPSSCCSSGMRKRGIVKKIEAISAPILSSSMSNLYPLIRGESVSVFDYKKMEEEEEEEKEERREKMVDSVNAEKLDQWITQSIGEIVRNIGEAPFLVQIFSQGPSMLRLEKEEASPESWPLIKRKWNQSNSVPDGVILVEQLKDEESKDEEEEIGNINSDSSTSKTWGLVVQGRGMECAASCYILNTCRVKSTAGFCTHFCLVRAKCFGETLDKQLSTAWLQGR